MTLRDGSRVTIKTTGQDGTLLRRIDDGVWLVDIDDDARRPEDRDGLVDVPAGNLVERIPRVGDPATECVGSDRYPYTVVAVSPSGKTIKAQQDREVFVKGSEADGSAEYVYERNPKSAVREYRLDKNGVYRHFGTPLIVGHRRYYRDPSY